MSPTPKRQDMVQCPHCGELNDPARGSNRCRSCQLPMTPEPADLAHFEAVIERGLNTFVEVGNALLAIRDQRLYRAEYATFEEYCERRWQLSRPRAYELMTAADVVSGMPDTLPKPTNARQANELARVPEEQRADVWRETVERTGGKPTAAAIRQTYSPPPVRQPDAPPSDAALLAGADWTPGPEPEGVADRNTPVPSESQLLDAVERHMPGAKAEVNKANIRARVSRAVAACTDIALIHAEQAQASLTDEEIANAEWLIGRAAEWAAELQKTRPGLRVVGGAK